MSENRPLNDAEAAAALDWYRAAGVDMAVLDEPVDRFAASVVPPRSRPAPVLVPQPGAVEAPVVAASLSADPAETRALAAGAPTLEELRAVMEAYEGCVLKKRATQLCSPMAIPRRTSCWSAKAPANRKT